MTQRIVLPPTRLPSRLVARRQLGRLGVVTAAEVNADITAADSVATSLSAYQGQSFDSVVSGAWGDVQAYGQAAGTQLSSEASAWYNANSGKAAQQAAINNGAAAAVKIADNGFYNCHGSPKARWECEYQSGQEAIAVAGGAAILIAQAAFPPAAAVLTAYFAIAAAADALAHEILKWVGAPVDPSCVVTGQPITYPQVLTDSGVVTAPADKTFAAFALPIVGGVVAGVRNCDPRAAGARQLLYTRVLPGMVQMWNNMSVGSGVDYYVPRMYLSQNDELTSPDMVGHQNFTTNPTLFPVANPPSPFVSIFYNLSAAPYAFQKLSDVPVVNPKTGIAIADPRDEGKGWLRIRANAGPSIPGGAFTKTAAEVAASAVTAATAATLVYSYATGKAWNYLLKSAWGSLVGLFE